MAIILAEGLPGSGKNLWLIRHLLNELLPRNEKIFKKTGIIRKVMINNPVSDEVLAAYHDFIGYWAEAEELVTMRNCDVVIDEIANYFDARDWEIMSSDVKTFMRQHRKRGVNIYCATQDYSTVDKNIRRLTARAFRLYKIIGSPDLTATRPVVKHPWGLILGFDYDMKQFRKGDEAEFSSKIPAEYFFITKRLCNAYNTQYEIHPKNILKKRHIEYGCMQEGCRYHFVAHK